MALKVLILGTRERSDLEVQFAILIPDSVICWQLSVSCCQLTGRT